MLIPMALRQRRLLFAAVLSLALVSVAPCAHVAVAQEAANARLTAMVPMEQVGPQPRAYSARKFDARSYVRPKGNSEKGVRWKQIIDVRQASISKPHGGVFPL